MSTLSGRSKCCITVSIISAHQKACQNIERRADDKTVNDSFKFVWAGANPAVPRCETIDSKRRGQNGTEHCLHFPINQNVQMFIAVNMDHGKRDVLKNLNCDGFCLITADFIEIQQQSNILKHNRNEKFLARDIKY